MQLVTLYIIATCYAFVKGDQKNYIDSSIGFGDNYRKPVPDSVCDFLPKAASTSNIHKHTLRNDPEGIVLFQLERPDKLL